MSDPPSRPPRFGDLATRLGSGLALGALGAVVLWIGGALAVIVLALMLAVILWELDRMIGRRQDGQSVGSRRGLAVAIGFGALALIATPVWGFLPGLVAIAVGAFICIALRGPGTGWMAAGLAYCATPACFLLLMRQSEPDGVYLVLWLVAVVVATDVGAYFVGRIVGGPKLWRRVSPGKTWSGAIGGLSAATLASLLCAPLAGIGALPALALGIGVAVAAQLGDLLESSVKRRFGVKDSSDLIPGHGGVMDRVDGLLGGTLFLVLCDLFGFGVLI